MPKTPEEIMRELSLAGGTTMLPDGSVETQVGAEWAVPIVYPTKRKVKIMMDEEDSESKVRRSPLDKPVENTGPVPLMPNLDANARHVITSIRVIKKTPPGDGIKGEVPESTTLDFIAKRWGDGIYDFEALNEASQILRRNTNVKIAMGYSQGLDVPPNPTMQRMIIGGQSDEISEKLLARLDEASKRAQQSSEAALIATQKLSQDYAAMVREDSKERASKDRDYHDSRSKQQTDFFQTMLVSMQTMHEQAMERSREQFQQTLQMMQFSHQQTLTQNNPALLFQLFERGLKFGAEANAGEEESPLSSILGAATQGLSTVKDMMMLQQQPQPAMLPASAPPPVPTANPKQQSEPKKKAPISKDQLLEVVRLKKIAESRGLDFNGLLKQAQMMVANMPSEDEPGGDENEDSEESSEDTTGGSDLA